MHSKLSVRLFPRLFFFFFPACFVNKRGGFVNKRGIIKEDNT